MILQNSKDSSKTDVLHFLHIHIGSKKHLQGSALLWLFMLCQDSKIMRISLKNPTFAVRKKDPYNGKPFQYPPCEAR